MGGDFPGIVAGLGTAILWTVTAVCFEVASRRIGSLAVNVLRLLLAALLFSGLSLVRSGAPIPPGVTGDAWLYLGLSGLVGFVIGDLLLFQAFVLIGARLSMLIYAGAPLFTSLFGFLFLGERMSGPDIVGMLVVVSGIALAVSKKPKSEASTTQQTSRTRGILYAVGGTVGQAAGLLLGKRGAGSLDSFSGTQIRVLLGLAGFVAVMIATRRTRSVAALGPALITGAESSALRRTFFILFAGSVFGPFVGVSLGLYAAQHLPTGTAATLMSLVPVLLIPVSAVLFKEKVGVREILGAVLAVGGVALLAW